MRRESGHSIWLIWAVVDGAGLAGGLHAGAGVALAMHLIATIGGCLWIVTQSRRSRTDWKALLAFSALFAFLNPIIGPALVGWLWGQPQSRREDSDIASSTWVIGNREHDGKSVDDSALGKIFDAPMVSRLDWARHGRLRSEISKIRRNGLEAVTILLRSLAKTGDARTQLFAGTALLTIREERDGMLRRLQRAHRAWPEDNRFQLWLASGLRKGSLSGLETEDEIKQSLQAASEHFAEVAKYEPSNVEALNGWADCLWRLQKKDEFSQLVERLNAVPAAREEALFQSCRLACMESDWAETRKRLPELEWVPENVRLRAIRNFWLNPPPSAHG